MSSGSEVRLRDIRVHEGDQARAWEELVYQLRPPVGGGHVETRKTRAPDGGVEWYELYDDGHHEGFQAKFNATLADALGGMRESVKAVASKRPQMTRLTFIVPYDFTDAASVRSKSDQDRWDDAVKGWKADICGADRLTFAVIRAGDVLDTLMRPEHVGRRTYWFGALELTDDWFSQRWAEACSVAGDRYTPEADVASRIQQVLDAVSGAEPFLATLDSLISKTVAACLLDRGVWDGGFPEVQQYVGALQAAREKCLGSVGSEPTHLASSDVDFAQILESAQSLISLAHDHWPHSGLDDTHQHRRIMSALDALVAFSTSRSREVYEARAVAIEGAAGQGKTHALVHAAKVLLDHGVPAIAIMGPRVRDTNWWTAFKDVLGGVPVTCDEFLQALDSLAEARACRAVILVDALNEVQRPRMWREELPALLTQVGKYAHIALIVSYRTDYREIVAPPPYLRRVVHPGLAGHEDEALAAYCALYEIPVPAHAQLDPAFSNGLFLRMYCAVAADGAGAMAELPTRTSLFARFAEMQSRRVRDHLGLPPISGVVSEALDLVADRLLANDGQAVLRSDLEPAVDELAPGRHWPETLFARLVSEGLLEMRPGYDGIESVAFPFQAYSEQLLAARILTVLDAHRPSWVARVLRREGSYRRLSLVRRLRDAPWLWSAMSVLLPERREVELIDLLPDLADEYLLGEAIRASLIDRTTASFGPRALSLLEVGIDTREPEWMDAELSLAPRVGHPANADWLHQRLVSVPMAERDASWSIDTFTVDDDSAAFERLAVWAENGAAGARTEQVRLAGLTLMWLLTSPNRFLRDRASKALAALLSRKLTAAVPLLAAAREVDDLYVQERMLTCVYGAVIVGGDGDLDAVTRIVEVLNGWLDTGLPVHVLARDSARGIVAWAYSRGRAYAGLVERFVPPYGAEAPIEPPTADELEERHGRIKDSAGTRGDGRAQTILMSCLDWLGDFNKYVVKSDVGFFSDHPLSGPAPTERRYSDPEGVVDADWAGRWIASRAIELGWTAERFAEFEKRHDLRKGREAHKAERFGKKYQWLALHELLARLADNRHPAYEAWNPDPMTYQGPWNWSGRDFDPTLPPSVRQDETSICPVPRRDRDRWAALSPPIFDLSRPGDEWIADLGDLPAAGTLFAPTDIGGREWIALQRHSSWHRDNALRRGTTQRERDLFFLQFSWLTPRNQGSPVYDYLAERGLGGRWMPNPKSRPYTQYLGEQRWAPVVYASAAEDSDHDIPRELRERDLQVRPAIEQYVWEGTALDCSLDESVNFYLPTAELLGSAVWVANTAEWREGNAVIAKTVRIEDGENGQDVLLADPDWLDKRLRELDADLIIGTLSEKLAQMGDDNDRVVYSTIWYVARMAPAESLNCTGPHLQVPDPGEALTKLHTEPPADATAPASTIEDATNCERE
ncbi:hypothetical protein ACFVVM_07275 [Nocardia sp. NPDC058176]|uniref:hypothetical protein n=1 Tax=Nocardia sp. NPDC058176 TaxID=3346368 RepID=UPI0036DE12DB